VFDEILVRPIDCCLRVVGAWTLRLAIWVATYFMVHITELKVKKSMLRASIDVKVLSGSKVMFAD